MEKMLSLFWEKRTLVLLALLGVLFLFSIIRIAIDPSKQEGIFGIGLPSSMDTYKSRYQPISIQYPSSWVAFDTPQGNHGDLEIITLINFPSRFLPIVSIAQKPFPNGNSIDDVIQWGIDRASQRQGYQNISLVEHSTLTYHSSLHNYYWVTNLPILGTKIARCMDWHVLKDHTGYVVSLCANQDHWSTVEPVFYDMIRSFLVE